MPFATSLSSTPLSPVSINRAQLAALGEDDQKALVRSLLLPKISVIVAQESKPESLVAMVLEMLMATDLADLVAMLESPETLQFVVVEACKVAERGGDLSGAKKGCSVM